MRLGSLDKLNLPQISISENGYIILLVSQAQILEGVLRSFLSHTPDLTHQHTLWTLLWKWIQNPNDPCYLYCHISYLPGEPSWAGEREWKPNPASLTESCALLQGCPFGQGAPFSICTKMPCRQATASYVSSCHSSAQNPLTEKKVKIPQ